MTSRKVLKSVLHNLLDTLATRESDYRGYWLFGQFPADLDRWVVDLCGSPPEGETPVEFAARLAIRRFGEQLGMVGLDMSVVQEASVSWTRGAPALGRRGPDDAQGHRVELRVRVVTDRGSVIERWLSFFAAPHDPRREIRRLPAVWGT